MIRAPAMEREDCGMAPEATCTSSAAGAAMGRRVGRFRDPMLQRRVEAQGLPVSDNCPVPCSERIAADKRTGGANATSSDARPQSPSPLAATPLPPPTPTLPAPTLPPSHPTPPLRRGLVK